MMFDLMEAKGYQVFVRAVIVHFDEVPGDGIQSEKVFTISMGDFDSSSSSSSSPGSSDAAAEDRSAVDEDTETKKKEIIKVDLVVDEHMAKAELLREHRAAERTGNEGQDGYLIYSSACMIVMQGEKQKKLQD